MQNIIVYSIRVSLGNVTTHFECDSKLNKSFVTNCAQNLPVCFFENSLTIDKIIDIARWRCTIYARVLA